MILEKENTIHLVICLDDNYVMPASVLIQSIGANKGDERIIIHAVSLKSLMESSKDILNSISERHGIKLEYFVFEVPEMVCASSTDMQYWSYEVFIKMFIPTIFPDLEKVLILDGDMIVKQSLLDLWNEDVAGYAFAGVLDSGIGIDPRHNKDVLYDIGYGYLNGGLLLMNLEYHRSHNLQQKYIDWIKDNPGRIVFNEQTIMNNVAFDCHKILPLRYNLQFISNIWKHRNNRFYSKEERRDAYYNPVVIHYIGATKPWHKFCPHPYVNEWDRYLRQTPFEGYRKERRRAADNTAVLRETVLLLLLCLNSRFLRFLRYFKWYWI